LTPIGNVPYLFFMSVETLGDAFSAGWTIKARCAWGKREGLKSIRECTQRIDLDMETLVWTRGKDFPISLLDKRLRCPSCGSRRVSIIFDVPSNPNVMRAYGVRVNR
jgi:hypothetical protein